MTLNWFLKTYQSHCKWYNYFSTGGDVWMSLWSILNVRLEEININYRLTVQPGSLWCRDKGGILRWILETGKQLAQAALAHKAGGSLIYKFRHTDRALVPGVSRLLPLPVVWSNQSPALRKGRGCRTQSCSLLTFWCISQYPFWFDSQAPLHCCHTFLIFLVVTETEATGVCN